MTSALLVDIGAFSRTNLRSISHYCSEITVAVDQRIATALPATIHVDSAPAITSWEAAFAAGCHLLISGTPFDLAEAIAEIRAGAEESDWYGAALILGANSAGSIVAPLNQRASSWSSLLAGVIGAESGQASQVKRADDIAADFSGSVLLARARRPRPVGQGRTPSAQLSAAATVQALLTDTGLQLSNRTDMPVHMRCHLGINGLADDVATVDIRLAGHESHLLSDAELGKAATVEGPIGVLRHWSHSSEVVYEGGQRRINHVDIRFYDADGHMIGGGSFGSHPALGIAANAREISAMLDAPFSDVSTRFASAEFQETHSLLSVVEALSAPGDLPS